MNNNLQRRSYGAIKKSLIGIAVLTSMSILVLWSWNTLAVDLFNLPEARFKHALAITIPLAIAFFWHSPRLGHNGEISS